MVPTIYSFCTDDNNHSRKFDRNIFALCVVKSYHTLNEVLFVRGDIANWFYLRLFFDLKKFGKCVKIYSPSP